MCLVQSIGEHMFFKSDVLISGIKPELVLGILTAYAVWSEHSERFTITSILDSKHKDGSLHYSGLAFDIRVFDLKRATPFNMASALYARLPAGFQVILESDHIHVEFDNGKAQSCSKK